MSSPYKRSLAAAGLALAALAAAACGGEAQTRQGEAPPPEVGVETVETSSTRLTMTLPGRTAAYRVAQVRPQVSGIIVDRLFEEGDEVEAGQPLYQIDSAPYEAALASAEASLDRAQAQIAASRSRAERFGELVKINAVSRQDLDDAVAASEQARADVASARAARDNAKIELDRTVIKAPIDGRIGRTLTTVGALVTANQAGELAVINALDPIYVDVAQSSSELLKWKRRLASGGLSAASGDELGVSLKLEDGSVYEHKGKLALTEVSVDPSTGGVTLRAVFPNPDNILLPGMFVRAEIVEGVRSDAILAPQRAISRNAQGEGVAYVVGQDNKTEERVVETDRAVGDQWIVASGLEPGDRLVVEGFQRFRAGDVVSPVASERVADARDQEASSAYSGGSR